MGNNCCTTEERHDADYDLKKASEDNSYYISPPVERGNYQQQPPVQQNHLPSGNGSVKLTREMNMLHKIVKEVREKLPAKFDDPNSLYSHLPQGGPFKYTDGSTYQGKLQI